MVSSDILAALICIVLAQTAPEVSKGKGYEFGDLVAQAGFGFADPTPPPTISEDRSPECHLVAQAVLEAGGCNPAMW